MSTPSNKKGFFYNYQFPPTGWKGKDAYAELTPILKEAGTDLYNITQAAVMHEVLGKKVKDPITGEITRNLARDMPVPNLVINSDWLDDIKKDEERKKFKPKEYEAIFTDPHGDTKTMKVNRFDYESSMEDGCINIKLEGRLI